MNETQRKLIRATEQLLREEGLARITTRKIAQTAGISEGALYHYFRDKAELLDAVVQDKLVNFQEVLESLPLLVGQNTVSENLQLMMERAYETQIQIVPFISLPFADQELLVRSREILKEREACPADKIAALTAYLRAEQRLERISAGIDAEAAAKLLLASTFHAATLDQFFAPDVSPEQVRQYIKATVQTLMLGLEPRAAANALPDRM